MGEWGKLHKVVEIRFDGLTGDIRQKAGRLAAASAWGLHNWESMERLPIFQYCKMQQNKTNFIIF